MIMMTLAQHKVTHAVGVAGITAGEVRRCGNIIPASGYMAALLITCLTSHSRLQGTLPLPGVFMGHPVPQ